MRRKRRAGTNSPFRPRFRKCSVGEGIKGESEPPADPGPDGKAAAVLRWEMFRASSGKGLALRPTFFIYRQGSS